MGMLPVGESPGAAALTQTTFASAPAAAPAPAGGMLAVQQSLNDAHKENTYSSVKGMVDSMIAQMTSQTEDESKHKEWCDAEITKSKSAQDEKSARLQRLATKIG